MRGPCGTGRCGGINGECEESRRKALVAMVHTTDLGDGHDFSDLGRLYRPLLRAILVQGKMRPGAMVIVEVRYEDAAQMALVEDDQVVQTLAAYRTDDPLDVSILPG
jgi:hypothetical protein